MQKKKRAYYPLDKAAEVFGYEVGDLLHFAEMGELKLSIKASNVLFSPYSGTGLLYDKSGNIIEEQSLLVGLWGSLFDLSLFDAKNLHENSDSSFSIFYLETNEFSEVVCSFEDGSQKTHQVKGLDYFDKIKIDVPNLDPNSLNVTREELESAMFNIPDTEIEVKLADILVRTKEMESFLSKNVELFETLAKTESREREQKQEEVSKIKAEAGKKGKDAQDISKFRQYEIIATEICGEAISYKAESCNVTAAKLLKLVEENGIEPYVKWSFDSVHGKVMEKLRKQERDDLCTKGRPQKIEGVSKEKFIALQKQARQKNE
jgi:hypothetical protein